jgi:hypothetical protein
MAMMIDIRRNLSRIAAVNMAFERAPIHGCIMTRARHCVGRRRHKAKAQRDQQNQEHVQPAHHNRLIRPRDR